MKILKTSMLTILGLTLLAGCGSTTSKDDTTYNPHKVDRAVLEKFKKDDSMARLSITNNSTDYSFSLTPSQNSKIKAHKQIYIDIDRSGNSGYILFEKEGIGAEYLLEDGNLFKYKGIGGSNWSWEYLGNFAGDKSYSKIPLDFFGTDVNLFDIQATILDENWDVRYSSNLERVTKSIDIDANKVVFDSEETGFTISNDDLNFYFNIYDDYAHRIFFVNSDMDNSTGYEYGYDYIIEDKTLYKYIGTANSLEWKWQKIDRVSTYTKYRHPGKITSVPKKLISDWSESIKVYAVGYDENWDEKVATNSVIYKYNNPSNSISVTREELITMIADDEDYSKVDVSKIKDFSSLFFNKEIKFDITNWDVSNATNMSSMFEGAKTFNQDISNWNVSKVTNMSLMFSYAKTFNQNISSWNVSNVDNMIGMFEIAESFNQDIGNWDVSNVSNMGTMFEGAKTFNQNIGNWNVGNVSNMEAMFLEASNFRQDLSKWDIKNVIAMSQMFDADFPEQYKPKK